MGGVQITKGGPQSMKTSVSLFSPRAKRPPVEQSLLNSLGEFKWGWTTRADQLVCSFIVSQWEGGGAKVEPCPSHAWALVSAPHPPRAQFIPDSLFKAPPLLTAGKVRLPANITPPPCLCFWHVPIVKSWNMARWWGARKQGMQGMGWSGVCAEIPPYIKFYCAYM